MGLLQVLGLQPAPPAAGGASAAPDPNQAAYLTARAAVQKLIDALNAHPQRVHVLTQIGQATAKLVAADGKAAAKAYPDATKAVVEAKALCDAAKTLADSWADYAAKRYDAEALARSFDSADGSKMAQQSYAKLSQADALANATPSNFPPALVLIKQVYDLVKGAVTGTIAYAKQEMVTVQANAASTKAFLAPDITQANSFLATADAAVAKSDWSAAVQNAWAAQRVLGPAVRTGQRRGAYEAERTKTQAAIVLVKGSAAVSDKTPALDARVAAADALASYQSRQFEQGVRALQSVQGLASKWLVLAPGVAAYKNDKPAADTELAALEKHAAAKRVAAECATARKLLADAATAAAAADKAADPEAAWAPAATALARAKETLATARKTVDGLGAALAAEGAAANPADAAGLQAAFAKLKTDGDAAQKAPFAAAAAAEFKTYTTQVAAVTNALTNANAAAGAKAAAAPLAAAAQALSAAKAIQAEHGRYDATLMQVQAELKALQASPRAPVLKAKIDAVVARVADAAKQDKNKAGAAAATALAAAGDAAAAARAADKSRAAFDTHTGTVTGRIVALADAKQKAGLQKAVAAAVKQADAFAFPVAEAALRKIEVQLDKTKLQAAMTANPNDPQISTIAAQMVGNGGSKEVDDMIQAVPDGGDVRLINGLAKGRYGVSFTSGAALPAGGGFGAGDQAKAMKVVCKMFSEIPQDIVNNPSIKAVSHTDAKGSAGGSWSYDDANVRMNGRPGIPQKFGAYQVSYSTSPRTGTTMKELPDKVDDNCKAVNDDKPVEYLSFAAAHEVGHGIDDERGFMTKHGSGEPYGGWITYGSSVQPICDAIVGDPRIAAFCATPEHRKYVLDRLQNKPTTPPTGLAAPVQAAWVEFDKWYKTATSADVYRRQGDCDYLKIGDRIYHEAYARQWVSYLAAARTKALTGYQFRAPGEWFAELYAGFRAKKLKPNHPAMSWLSKL